MPGSMGAQQRQHVRKHRRKRWAIPLVVLLCACGVLAGCATSGEEPAARVNGTEVRQDDVDRAVDLAALSGQTLTRKQALQQLISEELLRREAARLGITVPARAIDARVADLTQGLGGQAELKRRLKDAGLTVADVRGGVEAVLVGERLQAAKFPGLRATRAEAEEYYESHQEQFFSPAAVNMGAIVVRAEGIARNAIERIEDGQEFENAARQFTIDPEGRYCGGMLGWIATASLPPELAAAFEEMEVGELSEPVAVGPLWYVLKLFGRRAARTTPFAEVAEDIRRELTVSKQAAALTEWVTEARERADIEILL